MNLQEFITQVIPLKNKLYRFAKRILDQQQEAEDVVQEVYIRLWMKREKLDEYRSIEALAMVTTKNMCLDRIKSRRYPVDPLENHRGFLENLPETPKQDYSEELYHIRQAMKTLPRQQQMILQLRDIEGYGFKTIAEIMEMNENTVRVNLSRARKHIREMITTSKVYDHQRN